MDKYSTEYIERESARDEAFKNNVEILDLYDFSEFLTDGRNLSSFVDVVEERYDNEFRKKYGIYVFDYLNYEDLTYYLNSRYNVWLQEYTDWVVRHDNGHYEQTKKRERRK